MNFGFNEEQELLRSTARKFFENECSSTVVRTLMDSAEAMTPELWAKLAEQGWLGLIYPEAYDGMGLGLVDLVVLMEEMGRAVVPGPYFSSVLLGGLAVLEAGSEAQKKEWLPKVAAGLKRVSLAWLEPSATLGADGVTLAGRREGRGIHALGNQAVRAGRAHGGRASSSPLGPRRRRRRRASRCSWSPEGFEGSTSSFFPRWTRPASSARSRSTM